MIRRSSSTQAHYEYSNTEKAFNQANSSIRPRAGQRVSLHDLLFAVLLKSANDAAVVVAEGVSGSESGFAQQMNLKARVIGAVTTNFANPHGLTEGGHVTTARDLSRIFRYGLGVPGFREVLQTSSAGVEIDGPSGRYTTVRSHNRLLNAPDYQVIGKTGYTRPARRCYVGAAGYGSREVVIALLGSTDLWGDARRMLYFGLQPGRPTPVLTAARTPPPQAAAPIDLAARAPEPVGGRGAGVSRPGAARVPRGATGQLSSHAPARVPGAGARARVSRGGPARLSHGAASDRRRPATGADASGRGPRGHRPRSAGGGRPGGTHGAGAARLRAGGPGQSASQSPSQPLRSAAQRRVPTGRRGRAPSSGLRAFGRPAWKAARDRRGRGSRDGTSHRRPGAHRRAAASNPQARDGRRGGGCCGRSRRRRRTSQPHLDARPQRGRSAWRDRGPRSPVVPRCEDPDRIGAILGRSAESRGGRSHDGTRLVAHAERDAHADHERRARIATCRGPTSSARRTEVVQARSGCAARRADPWRQQGHHHRPRRDVHEDDEVVLRLPQGRGQRSDLEPRQRPEAGEEALSASRRAERQAALRARAWRSSARVTSRSTSAGSGSRSPATAAGTCWPR